MYVNAEKDGIPLVASPNDTRITKIGRLIVSLYNGELSLINATKTFTFSLVSISTNIIIFGKK